MLAAMLIKFSATETWFFQPSHRESVSFTYVHWVGKATRPAESGTSVYLGSGFAQCQLLFVRAVKIS